MDTYNSSTAYILLYKLIMECYGGKMSWRTFVVVGIVECLRSDRGGGGWSASMVPAQLSISLYNR